MVAQVITLPTREDRRALFLPMAKEQGLAYEFHTGAKMSTPAKGINLAHRKRVMHAKEQGLPRTLILEDDAFFTAPGAYQYFLAQMPATFDLYLGGIYGGTVKDDGELVAFCGLHCYVVDARFYDRFLAVPPDGQIDVELSKLQDRDYRICLPYPCMQRSGYSDNIGKHADYANWAKGKTYTGGTNTQHQ